MPEQKNEYTVEQIKAMIDKKLESLPELPCRVDEMTAREYKLYCQASNVIGFLVFLQKELSQ